MDNKEKNIKDIETIEISIKDIADIYSLDEFINAIKSNKINEKTHYAEYMFINNRHSTATINLNTIQKELFMAPQIKHIFVYEK